MADENPPGGGKPDPGGEQEKSPTVSREHHERVLAEKKKAAAELAEAKAKLAEREAKDAEDEEKRLLENNQAKTALEKAKADLKAAQERIAANEAAKLDAKKFDSFFGAIGGKVDRKFWNLIDIDQIKMDESGEIDETSVANYVKQFKSTYPETISKAGQPNGMPNDKPGGTGAGELTHAEWLKLPVNEKRKRMKEVK